MILRAILLSLGCVVLASGCGLGAEGNFTAGLTLDRCDGTYPVCQTTAGCTLGVGKYVEGSFPGARQFIVPAPEEAIIKVKIFFREAVATGVDTEILWHEPGCFDTYQYASEGADIFLDAGNDKIFERQRQVFLAGDHLVEVFSDAVADYLLSVEVESAGGAR